MEATINVEENLVEVVESLIRTELSRHEPKPDIALKRSYNTSGISTITITGDSLGKLMRSPLSS